MNRLVERSKRRLLKILPGDEAIQGNSGTSSQRPGQAAPSNVAAIDTTPSQITTTTVSQVIEGDPSTISSKTLWEKAVENVRATKAWQDYCKALRKKNIQVPGETSAGSIADAKTLSEITKTAQQIQDIKAKWSLDIGGRTVEVRDLCDKVLNGLKAIKDLGTAATSLNPYASTAWGIVQFLISGPINHRETSKLCWEELPRILGLISRYQTFEAIYEQQDISKSKDLLEISLIELYTSLLKYQITIVIFTLSRSRVLKGYTKRKSDSEVQSILDDIEKQEATIGKIERDIDREIETGNWKRQFEASAEIKFALERLDDLLRWSIANLNTISQRATNKDYDELLDWISPIKYENTHNKTTKTPLSGTGLWLIDHASYTTWKSSRISSTLWLHGFMGSGKSCLAHTVIEDLQERVRASEDELFAYFYCDGTDSKGSEEIASSASILRALLKQISHSRERDESVKSILEDMHEQKKHKADLSEEHAFHIIETLMKKFTIMVILLDGLDECPIDVQRNLLRRFRQIFQTSGVIVKFFISSRHTLLIEQQLLLDFRTRQINIADNNRADISRLVREKVTQAASDPTLGLQHLYVKGVYTQTRAVIEKLEENASGMFRWIQLSLAYLHASITFREMSERLTRLERLTSLFDLYDELYNGMLRDRSQEQKIAIELLLTFVLYGKSRCGEHLLHRKTFLSLDGIDLPIAEAIAFVTSGSNGEGPRMTDLYSVQELWSLCPTFVLLDGHSPEERSSMTLSGKQLPNLWLNAIVC